MQVQGESSKNKRKWVSIVNAKTLVPVAITDPGRERGTNEDRCQTIFTHSGVCLAVLDGMGGAEGGEFAAEIGSDVIRQCLIRGDHNDLAEALKSALEEANRMIALRRKTQQLQDMGTTVVSVTIQDSAVGIGHVGDSRAYLVHGDEIRQLTVDHTYVQQLVDQKVITREEALPHPQSHILTQCLGSSPDLAIDVQRYWIWPPKKGERSDFIVLCTDGLYSMVHEDEIFEVVSGLPPREACEYLIKIANDRGGFDNMTVAIIPLRGHLKAEESPTWAIEIARRERRLRVSQWWQRSVVYHFVIAGVFSAGVSLMAIGVFFFLKVLKNF